MNYKTEAFFRQINRRFEQFNIVHQAMESGRDFSKPNSQPFTWDYQVSIFLQNNKLGHRDIYVYLSGENKELVAVLTTHTTENLLETSKALGILYGVSYEKVENVPHENNAYYFIF